WHHDEVPHHWTPAILVGPEEGSTTLWRGSAVDTALLLLSFFLLLFVLLLLILGINTLLCSPELLHGVENVQRKSTTGQRCYESLPKGSIQDWIFGVGNNSVFAIGDRNILYNPNPLEVSKILQSRGNF